MINSNRLGIEGSSLGPLPRRMIEVYIAYIDELTNGMTMDIFLGNYILLRTIGDAEEAMDKHLEIEDGNRDALMDQGYALVPRWLLPLIGYAVTWKQCGEWVLIWPN